MGFFDIFKKKDNKIYNISNYTTAQQGNWTNAPLEKVERPTYENANKLPSSLPPSGGKPKQYKIYKKRKYVVHVGTKGGHYIMVKGEKVYV